MSKPTINDLTNLPADVLTDAELAAYQPQIILDAISQGIGRVSLDQDGYDLSGNNKF